MEEHRLPSLREFVSAAIMGIAEGLQDAQEKGKDKGVQIYPHAHEDDTSSPMEIEFNLSVASIAQDKAESGFNLGILSCFGAKSTGEGLQSIESANRMHFIVPVNFVVKNIGHRRNIDWDNMPTMGM